MATNVTDTKNNKNPVLGVPLSAVDGGQTGIDQIKNAFSSIGPAVQQNQTNRDTRVAELDANRQATMDAAATRAAERKRARQNRRITRLGGTPPVPTQPIGPVQAVPATQFGPVAPTQPAPAPVAPPVPAAAPVAAPVASQPAPAQAAPASVTPEQIAQAQQVLASANQPVPAQFDSAEVLNNLDQIRALPLDQQQMILQSASNDFQSAAEGTIADRNLTDSQRGITDTFATGFQGALRDRFNANLTPIQRELERVQAAQAAEAGATQQEFENDLATRSLALDERNVNSQISSRSGSGGGGGASNIAGMTPLQQLLMQNSGITDDDIQSSPLAQVLMATSGGKDLVAAERGALTQTAGVIDRIAGIQSSLNEMKTGPIKGIFKKFNPLDTDAKTFQAKLIGALPGLARGVFEEVGVLTDADMERYAQTLPNLRNTEEVNKAVLALTLRGALNGMERNLEFAAAGNRDVSGYVGPYLSLRNQVFEIETELGVRDPGFSETGLGGQVSGGGGTSEPTGANIDDLFDNVDIDDLF